MIRAMGKIMSLMGWSCTTMRLWVGELATSLEALGDLVRFVPLPGQRHDSVGVAPLIGGIDFGALLGDKAFDADWLRAELDARGAAAVIPPKASRKSLIPFDCE